MSWLRALVFNLALFAWTAVLCTLGLPLLLAPRTATIRLARFWVSKILAFLKTAVGIDYEIRGIERIPRDGCIIAMKHQSAWDTLIIPAVLDDPVFVLKRELMIVPFFGWYLARAGSIAVDRKAGAGALRRMLAEAQPAAAAGRSIVIFPEGTRVAPGTRRPYQPGVAALYQALALPVVPAAVNSGLFWGRRSFVKHPGRIILEFLDPIPPGWPRPQLMAELEQRIETATGALVREALVSAATNRGRLAGVQHPESAG